MKPPYFDLVRFMLRNYLSGRTERIPSNTNACRAVWDTLSAHEQQTVEHFVLSSDGKRDTIAVRDYSMQNGTSEYAEWATIKRVFRLVAIQRGIWPDITDNNRKDS